MRFVLVRNAVGAASRQPSTELRNERASSHGPRRPDPEPVLRQVPGHGHRRRRRPAPAASRPRCRRCSGAQETGWCMPCVPYAGDDAGIAFLPEEDAGVWIEFEGGDVSFPIWVGLLLARGRAAEPRRRDVKVIKTDGQPADRPRRQRALDHHHRLQRATRVTLDRDGDHDRARQRQAGDHRRQGQRQRRRDGGDVMARYFLTTTTSMSCPHGGTVTAVDRRTPGSRPTATSCCARPTRSRSAAARTRSPTYAAPVRARPWDVHAERHTSRRRSVAHRGQRRPLPGRRRRHPGNGGDLVDAVARGGDLRWA